MTEALYREDGDVLVPSELTRGPWDPNAQHGGGPAAALGRAIERIEARHDVMVTRIGIDLIRPIPLAPLRVQTRMLRGGKRVQLIEAALLDGDDPVVHARAWRIRTAPGAAPPAGESPPPPGPETGALHGPRADLPGLWNAVEWRFVRGSFEEPGPATAWCRLKVPLVEGETPSPLQRVLCAADFGNGISGAVDFGSYVFINVDLTVHLYRLPEGEWVCLEAATAIDETGTGLAGTTLYDRRGSIGRSAQSLIVQAR